jgi:hypothetical protein
MQFFAGHRGAGDRCPINATKTRRPIRQSSDETQFLEYRVDEKVLGLLHVYESNPSK